MDLDKSFDEFESELAAQPNPGPHHRYMQDFVCFLGQKRGFDVFQEKSVLDGTGFVDVSLEKSRLKIAVEISVTTTPMHEAQNLNKCLSAGYNFVVLLCSNEHRLAMAKVFMGDEEEERLRFCTPQQFVEFLNEISSGKSPNKAPVLAAETSQSEGYIDPDAAHIHLGLAVQTLAKLRSIGGGPPFYKVGRLVFYKRSELDEWMSTRRKRNTSEYAPRKLRAI